MFGPGQLMTLQKLAKVVSQKGAATFFDEGALVGHFVMAAAQVNGVRWAFRKISSAIAAKTSS